jgi:hypothetical protein
MHYAKEARGKKDKTCPVIYTALCSSPTRMPKCNNKNAQKCPKKKKHTSY